VVWPPRASAGAFTVASVSLLAAPISWHSLTTDWGAWVALGTIALALSTAGLGLVTLRTARDTRRLIELTRSEVGAVSKQADATRDQAETSRRALEAQMRPLLVDGEATEPEGSQVELSVFGEEPPEASMVGSVRIRNAGNGVALLTGIYVLTADKSVAWDGFVGISTIAPGETTSVMWTIPLDEDRNRQGLDKIDDDCRFWIALTYTDAAGQQNTRTEIDARSSDQTRNWSVAEAHIFPAGSPEAFASTRTQLHPAA
jgi:hypothetical protein